MSTNNFGPGVGASTSLLITPETTLGRLVPGGIMGVGPITLGVDITSESIKHNIAELTSATLDPTRGVKDTIRGASDVSGDISFELRGEGYGNLIKSAMGNGPNGGLNYVVVDNARGDIGVQADGYTAPAAVDVGWEINIKCERSIIAEWETLWTAGPAAPEAFVHVERDLVSGYLTANPEQWDELDGGLALHGNLGEPFYRHTLGMGAALGAPALLVEVQDNSWIFPVSVADFGGSYLHYMELGQDLVEGMNVDILRDIALFVYTGMKPNTWTMNFNSNEIVNGTFGMVGIKEFAGSELTTEVINESTSPAGITVSVDDLRIFQNHPTNAPLPGGISICALGIGGEGEVYYDVLTPVPALGGAATLDTDGVHFDVPIPGTILTDIGAAGGISYGTDIVCGILPVNPWRSLLSEAAFEWGWFAGQPCWPMSHRVNDTNVPVDVITLIPDVPPFSFFEAHVEMNSGLVNTAAAGIYEGRDQGLEFVDVMSANFTVDQGIFTDKYELGSRFRKKAPAQQRNVTGTLSIEFDDMRQYWRFFTGRKFAFSIRCISDDADRGQISGCDKECPYSACFFFRRCGYTGETPSAAGTDMIVTDMPYRALVYKGVNTAVPYVDKAFSEMAVWLTNAHAADYWS